MKYAIVVLLSLVFALLGFITEVARSNIRHLENGREPNAGASIFPVIPFGPLFVLLVVWCCNQLVDNLGYWMVGSFFAVYVLFWWNQIRRLNRKLDQLRDRDCRS